MFTVRRLHLGLLALAALLVQLALHYTYLPWWCGDSAGYTGSAASLYGSWFAHYLSERTPGYPLFLLTCEMVSPCRVAFVPRPAAAQVITWVQSALSVGSVVLLYLSIERLQVRAAVNFAVSLLFALLAGVGIFAMCLLPESLCTFFVILAVYLALLAIDCLLSDQPLGSLALMTGFAFGAVILVRPNMLFMWILFCAAMPLLAGWRWWRWGVFDGAHVIAKLPRPCLAGGVLFLIPWLLYNYERTGYLTLTLMTDATRTSAAYNLFDQVHPKDKVFGEIMDRYYRETNANGQSNHAYIWQAMGEISDRASEMPIAVAPGYESLRRFALYRYMGDVSDGLLIEHPAVWAGNAWGDYVQTFDFDFPQVSLGEMSDPVSVTIPPRPVVVSVRGWRILGVITKWEAWLISLEYLLTYAAAFIALRRVLAAPDLKTSLVPLIVLTFAVGAIVCTIAPCILATYSNRYSIPLISIFALCSAYVSEHGLRRFGLG